MYLAPTPEGDIRSYQENPVFVDNPIKKYRTDIILYSAAPQFIITTTIGQRSNSGGIAQFLLVLNPVSLGNSHGSLCLYSGILSSRAGTAAVKTIPIHDLISDTIKGRRTAGITVHGPLRFRPVYTYGGRRFG